MKFQEFTKGIIKLNPVFTLMLGLCPVLAVTTETINGIGMGLASTFVLLGSNIVVSLIKKLVPEKIRIPSYIIIIASFVTIVKLFMQAYVPDLYATLGIFVPLIVVNCMILGRAEAFASKNSIGNSVLDALGMGLGFTLALTILAAIREFIGSGQIKLQLIWSGEPVGWIFKMPWYDNGILVFILPAGAFITIGLLMGLINLIRLKKQKK